MPAEQRRGPATTVNRTVEWVDTDAAGHQHNSAIMRWVEAAEAQLMRELGLVEYFPLAPRVQQVINFRDKLWFGQQVTATVWVERVGNASLTLGFDVFGHPCERSAGGAAADGTLTTVHVPADGTASAPWPAPIRAVLAGARP